MFYAHRSTRDINIDIKISKKNSLFLHCGRRPHGHCMTVYPARNSGSAIPKRTGRRSMIGGPSLRGLKGMVFWTTAEFECWLNVSFFYLRLFALLAFVQVIAID